MDPRSAPRRPASARRSERLGSLVRTGDAMELVAAGPIDGIFGPRTLGALERWTGRSARGATRLLSCETLCPLIATLRDAEAP